MLELQLHSGGLLARGVSGVAYDIHEHIEQRVGIAFQVHHLEARGEVEVDAAIAQ